jgi:flavin reductase (DIM6/NTAB) family NADH-FMN oxidoreductase RutF
MIDHRKLRDCLGLFSTGIIIACARKKNFLTEKFSGEKILDNKIFSEKILKNKILSQSNLGRIFLQKLKKIFADEFFGMTINSFSSVSLEPSLALFAIDNKSSNLALFKKNRYFSLNILRQEQIQLAHAFATPKNSAKWELEPYFLGKFGNPVFQNSLGFFECKKQRVIKAGDHHIIIAQIVDFGKNCEIDAKPLIYYRSRFFSLSD